MKVVITPSFPLLSNEDMLQWNDMLVQLKEEGLVNHLMSISEFKLLCMERGLNEFRKDLRVFDCQTMNRDKDQSSNDWCDIWFKYDVAPLTNMNLIRYDLAEVAYFVKEIQK